MDIGSEVCLSPAGFFPLVCESVPSGPHNLHRRQKIGDLKASRKNDYIEFFSNSTFADNASLIDFLDAFRDEIEIFGMESSEIIGIEDSSFATKWKFWNNKVVVLLRCHLVDVPLSILFSGVSFLLCLLSRNVSPHKVIIGLEQRESVVPLPEWNVSETGLLESGEFAVWSFVIPLWASCKPERFN